MIIKPKLHSNIRSGSPLMNYSWVGLNIKDSNGMRFSYTYIRNHKPHFVINTKNMIKGDYMLSFIYTGCPYYPPCNRCIKLHVV